MVVGVTDGYAKELEVNGVGYRVAKEGNNRLLVGHDALGRGDDSDAQAAEHAGQLVGAHVTWAIPIR